MGRDRIHFTKDGYREQGTLLYRALMQSYNQMLKIRKDDSGSGDWLLHTIPAADVLKSISQGRMNAKLNIDKICPLKD